MLASPTLALSLGLLAISAPPALAGETQTLTTAGIGKPGYVRASVTVTWLSKRTFDLQGWVEDVCPADGRGAYLTVLSSAKPYSVADTNECGNGRVYFDPPPMTAVSKNPMKSLGVGLAERDAQTGAEVRARSVIFENWRTG